MKKSSPITAALAALWIASAATASAAINFQFTYTGTGGFGDPSQGAARRAALEDAANSLANYFVTGTSVTLTFSVNSMSGNDGLLASAGSGLSSTGSGSSFFQTIVQKKLLGGADDNGATVDGEIDWNWSHSWGLGSTVTGGEYDFKSTAMHELLHAMGFLSYVEQPGANNSTTSWTVFDSFLVDGTGARLVTAQGAWAGLDEALINGDVFFSGPNALAANGGMPVPIYAPDPWEEGSSGSHTSDTIFTGAGQLMMNSATETGPGLITLSPIELGILRDLGYNVIPEPGVTLLLLPGLFFCMGFRRRN